MIRLSCVEVMSIRLWFMLVSLIAFSRAASEEGHNTTDGTESEETEHEAAHLAPYSVLFPFLIMTFGVMTYYLLSRYMHALPYTAVMFLMGTIIGLGVESRLGLTDNNIHVTSELWSNINGEVLLLVFLPGLIFKDSLGQNPHLFSIAIWQLLNMAFPMVLGGTCLTALVGYYIFPYGWSFSLAMTFGSILSATDPVAVAALLDEVGAPPRLKTHIGGESLLNDGSAIVFFSIFSQRFYAELGVEGFGSDIDLAEGVAMFCQKAIGGACVGLFFGMGMLAVLILLDHRFSKEENITQVMAALAIAYLNYYVADFVWKTSGVVATLVAGLFIRFFGRSAINDVHLLDNFFALLEHMLNTVLFSLGGLVFGTVIVLNQINGFWVARDWGYLILLYVLLTVIRAILFVVAYPLTVRTGLKTNWQETVFQIHGGLRGAVGIALAINLDNTVAEATGGKDQTIFEEQATQMYQMVGGVAFLTLLINGTTAGPILRKLGLADSTETRKKITEAYKVHFRAQQIDSFVHLLTNDRFKEVDFGFVKKYVPYLDDLTLPQLCAAVEKMKETTPRDEYKPPYLHRLLPYFVGVDGQMPVMDKCSEDLLRETPQEYERKRRIEERKKRRNSTARLSTMRFLMEGEPLSVHEMRLLFISMVRAQYEKQVTDGELESQRLLTVALQQSLEDAEVDANEGKTLDDYVYLQQFCLDSQTYTSSALVRCLKSSVPQHRRTQLRQRTDSFLVEMAMAFVFAHERAEAFFKEQFGGVDNELSEGGKIVLAESRKQVDLANQDLREKLDKSIVELAVSVKFCKILLNKAMRQIDKLVRYGLLKDAEAEEIVDEVKHLLDAVILCEDYEGEIRKPAAEGEDDEMTKGVLPPIEEAATVHGDNEVDSQNPRDITE